MKILRDKDIKKMLIILVLCAAFFLRVYKISEYPAGLNADEAAIGYNAHSLLETGKDEFGHSWPINFQSFNDFKPGLYFYLVLPFVKILGLNELGVRLPSVILGTATVFLVYLLVSEFFKNSQWALLAALLLAISPWHLHFSRGGWETNTSVFFIIFGLFSFCKALKSNKWLFGFVISFVFAMYTYHSARVIVPLLGLGLIVLNYKEFIKKVSLKTITLSVFVGVVLISPLGLSFLDKDTSSRFSGVGIFADQGPFWRANELRGQHKNFNRLLPKILHNRYLEYSFLFIDNYLRHYSGNYLFISGDEIQRNRVPEMGQMYLIEFPLLILGLYFLIKEKPPGRLFLLWWLAMAPVASSLTFQSPNAIRSLNMVIPLVIITAFGVVQSFELIKQRFKLYFVFCILYFGLLFWNFSFYLHQYYVHYPKIYPSAWEYGFKELVSYVSENQDKYDKIVVTTKYDQPYILFAFYLKYPPEQFQKEAKLTPRDQYGFSTVEHFDKYYFGGIKPEKYKAEGKTLIVGIPNEIPDSATITKRIYFKDGKTEAFRIIEY